jgi:2',3'-cyclic-nucleotide 2'-phosphodiesterase (5'-nucleotidase family)
VDLLLVDSGDHHDGAGIVSVYPNTQEHSQYYRSGGSVVDYHLSKLGYDVLAIGNHELYKYPDALQVADDVRDGIWDKADRKNGGETSTSFLTSNVEITLDGRNRSESIGARYSKFKTRM